MNIVFLASGNGGNLKFLHRVIKERNLLGARLHVIADRECGAIDFARDNDIFETVLRYARRSNKGLLKCLREIDPDIIITTWHKILDEDTVLEYDGKLINLHYSLLPAFGGYIGTAPIELAYEKGCRFVGATCHHVDKEVDSGKIISQAIVEASIPLDEAINEVFRKGCLILLNSVLLILKIPLGETERSHDSSFSPALKFDSSKFDEQFWNDVRLS